MNNIITDIKALQEETLLNLQSSKANNTIRAYKLKGSHSVTKHPIRVENFI